MIYIERTKADNYCCRIVLCDKLFNCLRSTFLLTGVYMGGDKSLQGQVAWMG